MSKEHAPLIAYVEDDPVLRSNFSELFTSGGYRVLALSRYDVALECILQASPDMAVIDIELGEMKEGGLELCRVFRQTYPDRPVILLTSHDEIELQSRAWEFGADDYVAKDTSLKLIMIRISALLDRYQRLKELYQEQRNTVAPGITIDSDRYTVFWKGSKLDLSLTQFWIIKLIAESRGAIVDHEALQAAANIVVEPNTIVAHVKNIRAQFKRFDPGFDGIRTERGLGYRWVTQ